MQYFNSDLEYMQGCTDPKERVRRYDAMIIALEDAALRAAANEDITEYSLDDGQTKIRAVYRSATQIAAAINTYDMLRQRVLNRAMGSMVRLVDEKNFRRG